jgi:hypothetical protein
MFAKILVLLHLHSMVVSYIIHPSKMTRHDVNASETCFCPMTSNNHPDSFLQNLQNYGLLIGVPEMR